MIGQYLPQTNENATLSISQKILELNKAWVLRTSNALPTTYSSHDEPWYPTHELWSVDYFITRGDKTCIKSTWSRLSKEAFQILVGLTTLDVYISTMFRKDERLCVVQYSPYTILHHTRIGLVRLSGTICSGTVQGLFGSSWIHSQMIKGYIN